MSSFVLPAWLLFIASHWFACLIVGVIAVIALMLAEEIKERACRPGLCQKLALWAFFFPRIAKTLRFLVLLIAVVGICLALALAAALAISGVATSMGHTFSQFPRY